MKDIACQLILKWARQGSEERIMAIDDFARLTLDTIALTTMSYRFNSFCSSELHPYVGAMLRNLSSSGSRSFLPSFVNALQYSAKAQKAQDHALLAETGQSIIENRRAHPTDKSDLLNAMVYGTDPQNGKPMRDELIAAQMNTFLIAGHETTSGLLFFTFYHLLKKKQLYFNAQQEVDKVIGTGSIEFSHLNKLKYLDACLRESLRLCPTAPAIVKQTNPRLSGETVLLGGKYKIEPTDKVVCLLTKSQKDPQVYGADAAKFKPERMLDEEFDKLPTGAWHPFGNGKRACVGRPLAWQKALLVSAMIIQNFDMELDDPSYQLKIKLTLTIKPKDFEMKASLRHGSDATTLDRRLHRGGPKSGISKFQVGKASSTTSGEPMLILYGSNTGTCQAFAQRLASNAAARGVYARDASDGYCCQVTTSEPASCYHRLFLQGTASG